ncbi:hypothetical protein HZS_8084 [Henneguya salminicola]|nr:hypothetical protein HZS_8084 [Henneguya salminicola]
MENEDNNISEERSIISYLAQISQGSSADNESYQLSIDQMMDEYTEFDQDMSTNESPTTKQEELDNLEGQAPIEDILLQYKDYFEERDSIKAMRLTQCSLF